MTHQNWQIHSGTGRTELEKNEYARLTLSTLYTVFIRYPLNQKKKEVFKSGEQDYLYPPTGKMLDKKCLPAVGRQ
jgi:hypothetical protein